MLLLSQASATTPGTAARQVLREAGEGEAVEYATVDKPLDWFVPNDENYRGHPEAQVELLRGSLRQFGVFKNVVARPDGTVLAGHGMIAAAKAEGLAALPVQVFTGTDEEARALMVADNELSRPGLVQDDPDQLSQLLESLRADGMMAVTGHDDESLAALLVEVAEQRAPTGYHPDLNPELQVKEYTEADMEAQKRLLREQFQRERALEPITCPKCGEEFYVDRQ